MLKQYLLIERELHTIKVDYDTTFDLSTDNIVMNKINNSNVHIPYDCSVIIEEDGIIWINGKWEIVKAGDVVIKLYNHYEDSLDKLFIIRDNELFEYLKKRRDINVMKRKENELRKDCSENTDSGMPAIDEIVS